MEAHQDGGCQCGAVRYRIEAKPLDQTPLPLRERTGGKRGIGAETITTPAPPALRHDLRHGLVVVRFVRLRNHVAVVGSDLEGSPPGRKHERREKARASAGRKRADRDCGENPRREQLQSFALY